MQGKYLCDFLFYRIPAPGTSLSFVTVSNHKTCRTSPSRNENLPVKPDFSPKIPAPDRGGSLSDRSGPFACPDWRKVPVIAAGFSLRPPTLSAQLRHREL
jgi:hypothetical protein